MSVGAMRHKIEIQSMTVASDGGGGRAITLWKTEAYVHARITPKSGIERELGDQIEASTKYEILIRYRPDLNAKQRIKYAFTHNGIIKEQLFNITGIINLDMRNRYQKILCTEGVAI
jgi:SPP1 family predicted phage head-tail adaptor